MICNPVQKKLFSILILLVLGVVSFQPVRTMAHITGLNHHETRFRHGASLKLSYVLTIFYTDFEKIYEQVDQDNDGQAGSEESLNWLNTWKDDFYVLNNDKKYKPDGINIITNFEEVKNNAYPLFRFDVNISELKLTKEFSEFTINNSFRVSGDAMLEEWVANFDENAIEEKDVIVRSETEITGSWRLRKDPSELALAEAVENNDALPASGVNYGISSTNWLTDPKFWGMALISSVFLLGIWWFKKSR